MSRAPDACPRHQELVTAAFGATPSDDELERYATLVPTCPECRRVLAIRVGVHPGRLEVPSPRTDDLVGMAELSDVLDPQSLERSPLAALRRRPAIAVAAVLAAGALVALLLRPPTPTASPAEDPAVAVTPPAEPGAVQSAAPSVPSPTSEPAPASRGPAAPGLRAPRIVLHPLSDAMDAVADAGDWPDPPYEDLRRGVSKTADPPRVRSMELLVSGSTHKGGRVLFTVVSTAETELSLCVEGPERGIVWRGAVGAGRTPLTLHGDAQGFVFSEAGDYTFTLAANPRGCSDPVHVFGVEDVR